MKFNNILKILVIFSILGLSFSSFLALNHTMGNDRSGKMSSCILMTTNSSSCQMNVGAHLLIWQETFLASVNSNFIFILISLSIVLFVSYVKHMGTDPPLKVLKKYDKENPILNTFNYLLRALSKGLIHPEIYA